MRAAALVFALGACHLAEQPPPGGDILRRARALSARMCGCPDRACGEPVRRAWEALTREISGVTFTPEQVEGLTTEDQRFTACMAAIPEPTP